MSMFEKTCRYRLFDYELSEMVEAAATKSCLAIDDSTYASQSLFPDDFGEMASWHINIGKGIRLAYEEMNTNRDLVIHHTQEMPDHILGAFFLGGNFQMKYKGHKARASKESADVIWSHTPGDTYQSLLQANQVSRSAYLIIKPDVFNSLAEYDDSISHGLWDIFRCKREGICTAGRLPTNDHRILQDILSLRPQTPWDWLRLESKVIELVGNSLGRYEQVTARTPRLAMQPDDMRKIRAARDILIANMDDPPSIMELARLSGLNEFKLKKYFKELYKDTVYGYLRRYRLETAYHLLESGEINVTEAALKVGYATPSAFTVAFKKEFGISPVECRRKTHQV